jgi:cysteine desulfurase
MTVAPPPEVRAYLDHATASPLRPEVVDALGQVLQIAQADPGRPYEEALVIRQLLEDARDCVASLAGVTARQVVFEASIAESVTHAVSALGSGGTILASATSRQSVLDAARAYGALVELPVDAAGHLRLDVLAEHLSGGNVALVSIQAANHETGVQDDLEAIFEILRSSGTPVHLDATMSYGHVTLALDELAPDAATVSGELLGGPLGASATIVKAGTLLRPLVVGGAQERARRAGLENVLGIVGFGVVADVLGTPGQLSAEAAQALKQRDQLEAAASLLPGVSVVGDPVSRVPQLSCVVVEGIEAEAIVMALDRAGISVHSGSACSAETLEPSPVLAAMGLDADRSLRLSVGWSTSDEEVARFVDRFASVLSALRELRT